MFGKMKNFIVILILFASCSLVDIEANRPKSGEPSGPVIPTPDDPKIQTPGAPVVRASDSILTVSWTVVEEAENYEVYVNTITEPPTLPEKTVSGTVTVLTGLTNKTVYYVWIKAVNDETSSNFSPYSRGIPWPSYEAPATPGRPVIIPGTSRLTVQWEESGGADFYEVYINISTERPSVPEITTGKTNAVINNLEDGTVYYVWVRAANGAGQSGYSPVEAGTPRIPTTAPAIPSTLVLIARNREIAASWQAVEFATVYEVWLGITDDSGQAQKQDGDTFDTETVISGLDNETIYYVWIKAKNIIGTSDFSLSASTKPSAFVVLPETPTAPSVISGNREMTISWMTTEGARSYELWTGLINNQLYAEKYVENINDTTITLTNLDNETNYFIWLKARNNIGVSGFSPVAIGTPSAFIVAPPVPQIAPVVVSGSGRLAISWETVEGAVSYEVWLGTTSNPATAVKRGDDVSGLSAVITGLENGIIYYVWIKAKNSVGTSGFSPIASGTTSIFLVAPQSPSAPFVNVGDSQISLTWAAVPGAISYEVWLGTANNSGSASKYGADISDSLSATIDNLNNGTIYYLWLKAKNDTGTSGFGSMVSGKPLGTPGMPTLSPDYGQLEVTWTAVAGADEYEVYYGIGMPTTLATTTSGTEATITGLIVGTTYNVRLRARNTSGISDYGPSRSITTSISPGLYRGGDKIGNQNLSASLSWVSANAIDGDNFYIILGADEAISPSSLEYRGKTVGITLLGVGGERTITLNANGSMFTIRSGVTLTLDENITLVGRDANGSALVSADSGNLIINDGAKITGNDNGYNSGGIFVRGGTLTMNGGTISGNSSRHSVNTGGGIRVGENGNFTMNDGIISGNRAQYGGGGITNEGNFTMNGGIISENTSAAVNPINGAGGIWNRGNFIMNDGIIRGNTGSAGGITVAFATYGVSSTGSATMYGGIISGNNGHNYGGVYAGGTFKKLPPSGSWQSGIIYGSDAVGVDADGIPLKNTVNGSSSVHTIFSRASPTGNRRDTTAGQTDHIDTTTGRGLSANGEPPFGE